MKGSTAAMTDGDSALAMSSPRAPAMMMTISTMRFLEMAQELWSPAR
jgi:hypothetical protein